MTKFDPDRARRSPIPQRSAGAEIRVFARDRETGPHLAKPANPWRPVLEGGLSMRTAFQAQLKIVHIASGHLINAKDGLHYPFGGTELRENLRFLAS